MISRSTTLSSVVMTIVMILLLSAAAGTWSFAPVGVTLAPSRSAIAPSTIKETTLAATEEGEEKKKLDPKEQMANMMKPIKEAGPAGALSLFLWEGAFWALSIPTASILYYQTTGSWPDWSQKDDVAKVTAEAFAFANIARFALPLRVGLAVATTPWVKDNIVDKFGLFQKKDDDSTSAETE